MNPAIRYHLDTLTKKDPNQRYASFQFLIAETNQPVDWAYEAWDDLLVLLRSKNNHERTIVVQLLSNLAKSDPEHRMLEDLDQLMVVTRDERFVTARHSLQSLWKIGAASVELRKQVLDRLSQRFRECRSEKNGTLVRYDSIEVFRKVYDQVPDETVKETAFALIETEDDPKYRKKYAGLWKK